MEDSGGEWLAPVYDEKEVLRQWQAERAAEHAARDKARAAAAAAGVAAECAETPAETASASERASEAKDVRPAAGRVPESRTADNAAESAPDGAAKERTRESTSESGAGEKERALSYAEWARMRLEQLPAERSDANDPPEPDALWLPNSTAKFRDLKKNWDMALNRSNNEKTDMYFKRYGETPEEFQEARQRPYEAYFEKAADSE